jgi:hypothetical protein
MVVGLDIPIMCPPVPRPTSILPIAALVVGLLTGCGAQPSGSDSANAASASDPGRGAFEAVPLPDGDTVGADPQTLVRTLYGSSEPVEGNYTEETVTLSDTGGTQVVLFTRLGLPDDSVRGIRHRLELVPKGAQWQLTWAGRQLTCWPGRGHEDWGTAPCR